MSTYVMKESSSTGKVAVPHLLEKNTKRQRLLHKLATKMSPPSHHEPSKFLPIMCQLDENGSLKEWLCSLPKAKGWVSPHLYKYQGFWLTPLHLQGTLHFQHHFHAQHSDVLLVTTPKSGTTWLKAIVFTLINRTHHPVHSQNHPLLTNSPHDLVPFLELTHVLHDQKPNIIPPAKGLYSTHLPHVSLPESVKNSRCKIVYMCRNPRDTFVSMWHYITSLKTTHQDSEMMPFQEAFDMFCNGLTMAGPFWDHVLSYWEKSLEMPQKVLFLKYEGMKEEPFLHLERLSEFLECPFSSEEQESGLVDEIIKLCSFENMSKMEVNKNGKTLFGNDNIVFFRKGEVGDWKNHLTAEMVNRLDHITQHKFKLSGLKL